MIFPFNKKIKKLDNEFELLEDHFKTFKYPRSFLTLIDTNTLNEVPYYEPIYFLGEMKNWTKDWNTIIKKQYPKRKVIPFAKDGRNDDVFCFDATDTSGDPKVYIVHTFASPGWEDRGSFNNFDEWLSDWAEPIYNERLKDEKEWEERKKEISKYLSYILRHKPESIGLVLDNQGWADINELIEKTTELELTKGAINAIVKESDKQRFIIKENKIRANQGHSININLSLTPKRPPNKLYHGTATRFLESIKENGLHPQSRQYIHLSSSIDTAFQVGQRHGSPIVLEIDTLKMYQDGYTFFLSNNGVWLIKNIPRKYIKEKQR